jgi:hypothetical protein
MDENSEQESVLIELAGGPFAGLKRRIKGAKLPDEFQLYGLTYRLNEDTGKFVYMAPKAEPGIELIEGILSAVEIQQALASAMLTKKKGIGTFRADEIQVTFEKDMTQPGFVMHSAFIRVKVKLGTVRNRG